MRKSFYIFLVSVSILSLFLVSCKTTQIPVVEEEPKIETKDYEMIVIDENLDFLKSNITYPQFLNHVQLNRMVKNTVENSWKGFKSYSSEEWNELNEINKKNGSSTLPPFEYKVTSEVSYSSKYVSVLLNTYIFNGGAHGNTNLITYTINVETGKIVNIITASGLSYNEISELCRSELYERLINNNKSLTTKTEIAEMKEMINTGAFPHPGNFEIFTLNGKKLNVYFEPYSVAPYSYGIQKIEILLEN